MKTTSNMAVLALLGSTSATKEYFAQQANNGIIEMDMMISHKPSAHTSGLGNHLQQLSMSAGEQPDYIDKKLSSFFDIQIYS